MTDVLDHPRMVANLRNPLEADIEGLGGHGVVDDVLVEGCRRPVERTDGVESIIEIVRDEQSRRLT